MQLTHFAIRCKRCDALIASHDDDSISIRRGAMQATIMGSDFNVALTCYRCGTLRLLDAAVAPSPSKPPLSAGRHDERVVA